MSTRALDFPDNKLPNDPARTNALLELISDQLMFAALIGPGSDSLKPYIVLQGNDVNKNPISVLAERIANDRKKLGLTP